MPPTAVPPFPSERLADRANRRVNVSMTPTEAYEFGVKLATDDEFRARIERDPINSLAECHIYLPPDSVKGDVHLPDKADVLEALDALSTGREFRRPLLLDAVPDLIIFLFFIV